MNESFTKMSKFLLTDETYKNEELAKKIMETKNKSLENLDVKDFLYSLPSYSSDFVITEEQQKTIDDIITECKENIWYFFRELLFVGQEGFTRQFNLKLIELSVINAYTMNKKILLMKRHNSVSSSSELFASLFLYNTLFEDRTSKSLFLDGRNSDFMDYAVPNALKSNWKTIGLLSNYRMGKFLDDDIENNGRNVSMEQLTDDDIASCYDIICNDTGRKLLESNYMFIMDQIMKSDTSFLIKISEKLNADNVIVLGNQDRIFDSFMRSYDKIEIRSVTDLAEYTEESYKAAKFVFIQIPREEHETYQIFLKKISTLERIPKIASSMF